MIYFGSNAVSPHFHSALYFAWHLPTLLQSLKCPGEAGVILFPVLQGKAPREVEDLTEVAEFYLFLFTKDFCF